MQIIGCRELESNEGPWQQDAGQNGVFRTLLLIYFDHSVVARNGQRE